MRAACALGGTQRTLHEIVLHASCRWCRARGKNVVYICGTDEYGTATETKARAEGLTPRAICDKYHALHAEIYKWFDISFDHFGRTSTADPAADTEWPHTQIAHEIFHDNAANDNFEQKNTQQMYCEGCQTFLADRLVGGTCPKCSYTDASGDQCDKCGALLSPLELIDPFCKADASHTLAVRSTDHLFLKLDKLQPHLEAFTEAAAERGDWTSNALQITRSWLSGGLMPRAITRDLKWGTPVPPTSGMEGKVFYVWYDAPIGYISITANYTPEWRQWWQPAPSKPVSLVQFMGKDNVPFHTVIFPACLHGTGKPWVSLDKLSTTEYLQYEDGKFSKSRGVGVFGDAAASTGIPSEVWRYYLLAVRPESSDAAFNWDDMGERNNNELLKNLGNFVHRSLSLTTSYFAGATPTDADQVGGAVVSGDGTDLEAELATTLNGHLAAYNAAMEKMQLRDGLFQAMRMSAAGNAYLEAAMPWTFKSNKPRQAVICATAMSVVRLLQAVLEPFMPGFADKVCHLLNLDHMDIPETFGPFVPAGHALQSPVPVIRQLVPEELEALRARFSGGQEAAGAAAPAAAGAAAGTKAGKGKGKDKKGGKGGKGQQKGGGKKKGGKGQPDERDPIARLDLRVGVIKKAWDHPKADKLFCEEVDIGEGSTRQIASGLREHYTLEQMQGKRIVVVANLKPRPMLDFVSCGMVLCAKANGKVEFIDPPADAPIGARLMVPGLMEGEADQEVNPARKKNPWKFAVDKLATDANKVACYGGTAFEVAGGVCTAPTLAGAPIS